MLVLMVLLVLVVVLACRWAALGEFLHERLRCRHRPNLPFHLLFPSVSKFASSLSLSLIINAYAA